MRETASIYIRTIWFRILRDYSDKVKKSKEKSTFLATVISTVVRFSLQYIPSRLCFKYTENIRYKNRVRGLCLTWSGWCLTLRRSNYITDEGEESKKQQRQRDFYQTLAARVLCIKTFLLRCFMRSMKYSLPSRLSSTGPTSF